MMACLASASLELALFGALAVVEVARFATLVVKAVCFEHLGLTALALLLA